MAKLLRIGDESKTISEWAADERCEIAESTLRDRVAGAIADESILKIRKRRRANRNANGEIQTIRIFGEERTLCEWADDPRCQVSRSVLRKRYINGVAGPDLLKEPAEANKRKGKKKPNEKAFFHGQERALTTIAKMTGIPVETIRNRHRRGLRNLDLARDHAGKVRPPINYEMLRGFADMPRWAGSAKKLGYDCSSNMQELAVWER